MPILTKGSVSIQPTVLSAPGYSLDQLTALLLELAGNVKKDGGWGSLTDDSSIIDTLGVREFQVGSPHLIAGSGHLPNRVKARLYWWQVDTKALRYFGEDDRNRALKLVACDLVIAELPDSKDSFCVLASSRDKAKLATYVRPALDALFQGAPPASWAIDLNPFGEFDPDFFMWLMARYHENAQLSEELFIVDLREIAGLDRSDRSTKMGNGIRLDRVELLAMIMGGLTSFGPASLEISDDSLGLYASLRLFPDGSFTPLVGSSEYDHSERNVHLGERLADDLAFKVLPALHEAYRSDWLWESQGRRAYIDQARKQLAEVLEGLT